MDGNGLEWGICFFFCFFLSEKLFLFLFWLSRSDPFGVLKIDLNYIIVF